MIRSIPSYGSFSIPQSCFLIFILLFIWVQLPLHYSSIKIRSQIPSADFLLAGVAKVTGTSLHWTHCRVKSERWNHALAVTTTIPCRYFVLVFDSCLIPFWFLIFGSYFPATLSSLLYHCCLIPSWLQWATLRQQWVMCDCGWSHYSCHSYYSCGLLLYLRLLWFWFCQCFFGSVATTANYSTMVMCDCGWSHYGCHSYFSVVCCYILDCRWF